MVIKSHRGSSTSLREAADRRRRTGGGDARGVKGPFVFRTHAFFRPLAHWATFSLSMLFLLGNVTLTSGPVSRDGNPTQPPQAAAHTCKHTRRTAKAAHLRVSPAPDGTPEAGSSVWLCCGSINDGGNVPILTADYPVSL